MRRGEFLRQLPAVVVGIAAVGINQQLEKPLNDKVNQTIDLASLNPQKTVDLARMVVGHEKELRAYHDIILGYRQVIERLDSRLREVEKKGR